MDHELTRDEALHVETLVAYAAGETFVRYDPDPDRPLAAVAFALVAWDRHHGPNALRPDAGAPGVTVEDIVALVPADGPGPFRYDPALQTVRPLTGAEAACPEMPFAPGVRYAVTGEPFRLRSSIVGGLVDRHGVAGGDPAPVLAGLLRLDRSGRPLVEADAPLHLQLVSLNRYEAALPEATVRDPALSAAARGHVKHLMALYARYDIEPEPTFAAWIDKGLMMQVVEMDGRVARVPDDAEMALAASDVERENVSGCAKDVIALLNIQNAFLVHPDTPGQGIVTRDVDAYMNQMAWRERQRYERKPGGFVAVVPLSEMQAYETERLRTFRQMLNGEPVSDAAPGPTFTTYKSRRVMVLDAGDTVIISVQPTYGRGARGSDPLRTEAMEVEPGIGDLPPRRFDDTLGNLQLLRWLPSPSSMGHFRMQALAAAHAEGASLADLCAAYADAAECPADPLTRYRYLQHPLSGKGMAGGLDEVYSGGLDGNAEAAAVLRSFGGAPTPRLADLFAAAARRPVHGLQFDVRLLAQAMSEGATLLDLASEAYAFDRIPGEPELDVEGKPEVEMPTPF